MTELTDMLDALQCDTEWQRLPVIMDEPSRRRYMSHCQKRGIEALYIAIGQGAEFDENLLVWDDYKILTGINAELKLDERRFIELSAKIEFYRKVQTDVNNIVGYTTDALTVTNADKPYMNLAATIADLEKERRHVYYKMTRHALL